MGDIEKGFYANVANILENARRHAQQTTNMVMVYTYYEIGRMIVEEQQNGNERAEYGRQVLKGLSEYLTGRFGRGFSEDNLGNMRRFYLLYSQDQISETVSRKLDSESKLPQTASGRKFFLSWSHYLKLMRISNPDERHFYEIEAARNGWSLAELNRQTGSSLYERLALSRNKEDVRALAQEGQVVEKPSDAIKDPYVLEFLGLKEESTYSEQELETRIIDHLQEFLLELGRGFTFVGRQQRFTFDYEHFWVDLVFYNRILRCFVLFDLKLDKLTHQDIGQMQMYVHYYDRYVKLEDENSTIGILLCKEKNDTVIELTLPESEKDQIFASKYETVLPSKEELRRLLDEC
jgi:predicted nuclease of restriction endonuclease-like (RecB) superfamily